MKEILLPLTITGNNDEASEAKELAKQIEFKVLAIRIVVFK
jgi:hypothetical protein